MRKKSIFGWIFKISALISCYCCMASANEIKPIGILLAAGDITPSRSGSKCPDMVGRNDKATADIIELIVAESTVKSIPVRILALGDLAYADGTAKEFTCFAETWGRPEWVKDIMLPVIGNHDEKSSKGQPFYDFFRKNGQFILDQNGPGAGYYAVKFPDSETGPWTLLGLHYRKTKSNDLQLNWLEKQLNQSKTPCILAFSHVHPFSSGRHGHCKINAGKQVCYLPEHTAKQGQDSTAKQAQKLFGMLHRGKASLFLAGHDHNFESMPRLNGEGLPDPAGIRSFVAGAGGSNLTETEYDDNKSSGKEIHRAFGVLRIDLFADSYSWKYISINGENLLEGKTNADTCNRN
jgi:acid phosphatase type 7